MSDVRDKREVARQQKARQRLNRSTGRAFWIRIVLVALIDAALVYAAVAFAANSAWAPCALAVLALGLVSWAYLNPRAQASRWLTPGLVLMAVFVVYPVVYTAYLSLTNYQTGNLLTKDQAIERLEEVRTPTDEAGASLGLAVYRNVDGELGLLVAGPGVEPYFGSPRTANDDPPDQVEPIAQVAGDTDPANPPDEIDGYQLLTGLEVTGENQRLQNSVLDLPDGGVATVQTLNTALVQTGERRFAYDGGADAVIDAQLGLTCPAGVGTFYCDGVPEDQVQRSAILSAETNIVCDGGTCDNVPLYGLDQSLAGWQQVVGFENYVEIFTNEQIRAPFMRVLIWNVVFAFMTVVMTFAMGLSLALALKSDSMRGRAVYRTIYILPYAIPGFLSIFVWRGLLNAQFGQINNLLGYFGIPAVNWLGTTATAMISVLLVNLWLGFPYMFLINSGALTSIPEELIESARVDGASAWKTFRMITLPLLLVSTAPLLIGAFAFNFNNFALIYLLTNGGPPLTGYDVPVGATDILISFTFNVAEGAGRGSQYALASAIVVIIFVVLATVSAMSFRLTKKLEEIYDQ